MNTDAKILKKKKKYGWPSIPMSSTSTDSINYRLKIFDKKKNPEKFQKANLEVVACWQLFT